MPKKSKKDKAPKITYYEALLGYKISLKEKELEDTNFALKEITEKNENYKLRNERLKDSKEVYLRKAMKEYKSLTDETDKQEKCEKTDVLNEMKNLWSFQKQLEDELIDIRIQIKQTENHISQTKKEIRYWNDFNNRGKHELDMQIELLNQEMRDMEKNFEIMSNYFVNELNNTREQITDKTEQTVSKEHKSAAEKIFKEMDKYTVQMMHDNKWMAEKIRLYVEEARELNGQTSKLEKENIELMTKLFECNVSDLRVIKDAFQMQFLDNENIELNSILDIDLDKLNSIRPKSGLDTAVEKVLRIQTDENTILEEENEDQSDETFLTQAESLPQMHPSYVNLGPYEYKSLNLQGYRKPIYKPKPLSSEEAKASDFKSDDWPVTQDMLQLALDA